METPLSFNELLCFNGLGFEAIKACDSAESGWVEGRQLGIEINGVWIRKQGLTFWGFSKTDSRHWKNNDCKEKRLCPIADSKQRFCSVCLTYRLKSHAVLSEVCHSHQLREEEGRHIKLLPLDIFLRFAVTEAHWNKKVITTWTTNSIDLNVCIHYTQVFCICK